MLGSFEIELKIFLIFLGFFEVQYPPPILLVC
jgi:hypothetical protein